MFTVFKSFHPKQPNSEGIFSTSRTSSRLIIRLLSSLFELILDYCWSDYFGIWNNFLLSNRRAPMHIMHHSEAAITDTPYDPASNMSNKTLTVSNNSAFTRPHHSLSPVTAISPGATSPETPMHKADDRPAKGINFRVESLFSKSPSPLGSKQHPTDMDCSPVAPSSPPPENPAARTNSSSVPSFASHSVENILAKSSSSSSSSSTDSTGRCTSPTTQTYTWNASSFPWMQATKLSPSSGKYFLVTSWEKQNIYS